MDNPNVDTAMAWHWHRRRVSDHHCVTTPRIRKTFFDLRTSLMLTLAFILFISNVSTAQLFGCNISGSPTLISVTTGSDAACEVCDELLVRMSKKFIATVCEYSTTTNNIYIYIYIYTYDYRRLSWMTCWRW